MIKNLLLIVMAMLTLGLAAEAQYYPHYPRPLPLPAYPVPVPVVPVVPYVYTCNAVGLANGLITYGIGNDTFTASQRALYVCQSTGQVCQIINCR
ncbi:MAG: hypothetical protein JNM24_13900 [Bdellovibrionaceae bacterium]|nr:hypothetical protein [Pseudobdellovibrionaceae bacterium]